MSAIRRFFSLTLLIFLVGLCIFTYVARDFVRDHLTLRDYRAPAAITQLATDTGMTTYAQRLFYVNKPTLDDKETLNEHCKGIPTDEAVLGCFRGDRHGIYIFDVTEPLLQGVEQVTAAHEMLHQAYIRLSSSERQRIDRLLEDYYRNNLTDESVAAKMEGYKKSEPDSLANEMHSIFGTEITTLPKELEEYYKQYFSDRQIIVTYRSHYQAEFDKRKQQIDAYDDQLAALKTDIEAARAGLEASAESLGAKRKTMDNLLDAGNVSAYNNMVPSYNSELAAYKNKINETNQLINDYNALVAERNAISVQRAHLQDALDTRIDPATHQ